MTDFEKADLNGDGSISQRELEIYLEAKRREMEDEDAKRDQQRKMVWFALLHAGLSVVCVRLWRTWV